MTTPTPSVPPLADSLTTETEQRPEAEPFYLPQGDEADVFLAAYRERLPVLLKGPTGCGKTRFIEAMTHRLYRGEHATERRRKIDEPLVTVACHEDLSATDLVGRYLLQGDETAWIDGPLTRAVRSGAICYLDEVVEARKDTTVLIHALTDHRRMLPIEKQGISLRAHPDSLLILSYNPGYQSILKDLKPSTRQRFIAIELGYPPRELEARVIATESGVDETSADRLSILGERIRQLQHHGFEEGASTRLLIYAGRLIRRGVQPARACDVAISRAVADDSDLQLAVSEVVATIFP